MLPTSSANDFNFLSEESFHGGCLWGSGGLMISGWCLFHKKTIILMFMRFGIYLRYVGVGVEGGLMIRVVVCTLGYACTYECVEGLKWSKVTRIESNICYIDEGLDYTFFDTIKSIMITLH